MIGERERKRLTIREGRGAVIAMAWWERDAGDRRCGRKAKAKAKAKAVDLRSGRDWPPVPRSHRSCHLLITSRLAVKAPSYRPCYDNRWPKFLEKKIMRDWLRAANRSVTRLTRDPIQLDPTHPALEDPWGPRLTPSAFRVQPDPTHTLHRPI